MRIGQSNYFAGTTKKVRSRAQRVYIPYMSQYSGQYNLRKVRNKKKRFDSGMPEEWFIFVDLVQKALVGQNITTGSAMYKYVERSLKGIAKTEFTQQANLVGSCTVDNFTMVMTTMTVHIFPVLAYKDQKQYMYRYPT